VPIATPEDVIIAKLERFRMSDLDKHYFDARGVCAVQRDTLDTAYIVGWCEVKSILDLWQRLQRDIA
jgi:hypothetical protein